MATYDGFLFNAGLVLGLGGGGLFMVLGFGGFGRSGFRPFSVGAAEGLCGGPAFLCVLGLFLR